MEFILDVEGMGIAAAVKAQAVFEQLSGLWRTAIARYGGRRYDPEKLLANWIQPINPSGPKLVVDSNVLKKAEFNEDERVNGLYMFSTNELVLHPRDKYTGTPYWPVVFHEMIHSTNAIGIHERRMLSPYAEEFVADVGAVLLMALTRDAQDAAGEVEAIGQRIADRVVSIAAQEREPSTLISAMFRFADMAFDTIMQRAGDASLSTQDSEVKPN